MNRANRRAKIFRKPRDYDAFIKIIAEGLERTPCRVLGLCLMPNHWHLVLWPHADGDLSRLMLWITNTHVKRYRRHYHDKIGGHLYQGRFKSFPVQEDAHLLTVLRYVEANPLRSGLSNRVGEWPWSSDAIRTGPYTPLLCEWPIQRPADWNQWVEARWKDEELKEIRTSVERGRPFGHKAWVEAAAKRHGLEITLRERGGQRAIDESISIISD
jgi:putative transposase